MNIPTNVPEELIEDVRAAVQAETARLRAEERKLDAEATEAAHNAAAAEYDTQLTRMQKDKAEREEREHLSSDKYYRTYYFNGEVSGNTVNACMNQLSQWSRIDPGCEVEIIFSSPGGSIIDGMRLFDFISSLRRKGHHVTTSTLGWAASMAGILLQAGDKRVMYSEAWMLIHEVSFMAGGKIGEVEDTVEWLRRYSDRVLNIFVNRCKGAGEAGTAAKPLTKKQIQARWKRTDWWISSDQALEWGLCDEVR